MTPGTIVAIWIKRFKRGPMDPADEARLVAGRGIEGNANQGGKRHVTIIDEARWREAEQELGVAVDPRARRANVMLRGIDLEQTHRRLLRLGNAVVRIYGETRPCERMDEAHAGLRDALRPRWRGGAFAEIVESGTMRAGDPADWIEEEQPCLS
ncbi:MAG TPA: MOSC domain-containing protein [Thermoanaerobaculia bacterium]|nr:MOSC domain-containing protein [Thermoanaerobaculia bacterium]